MAEAHTAWSNQQGASHEESGSWLSLTKGVVAAEPNTPVAPGHHHIRNIGPGHHPLCCVWRGWQRGLYLQHLGMQEALTHILDNLPVCACCISGNLADRGRSSCDRREALSSVTLSTRVCNCLFRPCAQVTQQKTYHVVGSICKSKCAQRIESIEHLQQDFAWSIREVVAFVTFI